MKSQFVVKRDNVYAGILIQDNIIVRLILFKIGENNLANDLIYNTFNDYYIDGISTELTDYNLKIIKPTNLNTLLEHFHFKENLTQKDINKVYRRLLVQKRWNNICNSLFNQIASFDKRPVKELTLDEYWNLQSINTIDVTKPNEKEPYYSLIRKR